MEKNKTIVFTIVSLNYLKYAKILGNSLIKHNPNFEFIILLVDEPKDHIKFEEEKFEIITLNKINIKNIKEFTFKYDITELNTAVKPLFFEYLMKKKNPKHLIYLDPDICVYNKFDKILKKLKEKVASTRGLL